jgi:hypothetical protein
MRRRRRNSSDGRVPGGGDADGRRFHGARAGVSEWLPIPESSAYNTSQTESLLAHRF